MKSTIRRTTALVVIGLVVAACGGGDDPAAADVICEPGEVDAEELTFYNWSEYIDPELIEAFEDQYQVDVVEAFYESNEAMLAQIQAGVVYDLIVPSDYMVAIMIEEGLLLELQKDAIPNIGNLSDVFRSPPYDEGGRYSVNAVWMLLDPGRWYEDLPAGVPDFGPYNEHFVRDIGCAFGTFAVALLWAAVRPMWRLPLVATTAIFLTLHAALHVYEMLRGFVDADHWWLDLPGVYLPAILLIAITWRLRDAPAQRAHS